MFKFITFVTILALCHGAPLQGNPEIEIMKAESENGADGAYTFMYEGSDGSFREEKAVPMNVGEEDEYLAITGSYRYISAEGKEVEVHYTADTRGFIVTGQTIHDGSSARQPKSIQPSDESSRKTNSDSPSKALLGSSNENTKESSTEATSTTSSEIPSVSSSVAPSVQP